MDPQSPTSYPTNSPVRVLIVDDRVRTRKGLQAVLSTCGEIEIIGEAENGIQAIWSVEEKVPDVVVMDVRMPEMDGIEATRLIKVRHPNTKIVIISIYPTFQEDAYLNGADAFLVKGCPVDELLETILNCCNAQTRSDSVAKNENGEDKNGPLYPNENPDVA